MEQAIEEFNQLYPNYKAEVFERQCEIVETSPMSERDFCRLVVTNANGYLFPRELAGATVSFYEKAQSPAPMRFNCDGIFFSEIEGRKCIFACELKSSFDSTAIFHAREQIVGTLLRLRAKFGMLQTRPDWEYHGLIVSYEPTMSQLVSINKLRSNDARFSLYLSKNKHKLINGKYAERFYKPLAIPNLTIHYVGVPNRQPIYQLGLDAIVGL